MAFLNLNPETFTAGALINNVDAKVVASEFRMFTYPNSSIEPAPALCITIVTADDEKHEQVYTVGPAEKFRPSDNGKTIEVLSEGASVSRNSNLGVFIKSLVDAGFDASKLNDGNADVFIGIHAHFVRKAFGKNMNGKDKEVLVVDRLLSAPAAGAAKTNSPAAPAPAAANNDSVADEVIAAVNLIIAEAGGVIPRNGILAPFMKATKGTAIQKDGIKLLSSPDFINKNFDATATEIRMK